MVKPELMYLLLFGIAVTSFSFIYAAFGEPINKRRWGILLVVGYLFGMMITIVSMVGGIGGCFIK